MTERPPYPRTGDDMDLPEGKTCADCVHVRRCTAMFGHIPEDQSCDWSPSRFRQSPIDAAPADPAPTNSAEIGSKSVVEPTAEHWRRAIIEGCGIGSFVPSFRWFEQRARELAQEEK